MGVGNSDFYPCVMGNNTYFNENDGSLVRWARGIHLRNGFYSA